MGFNERIQNREIYSSQISHQEIERTQTNNVMLHLILPEEEWQDKHKSHTREEIIRPDKKFMPCRTRKQYK